PAQECQCWAGFILNSNGAGCVPCGSCLMPDPTDTKCVADPNACKNVANSYCDSTQCTAGECRCDAGFCWNGTGCVSGNSCGTFPNPCSCTGGTCPAGAVCGPDTCGTANGCNPN